MPPDFYFGLTTSTLIPSASAIPRTVASVGLLVLAENRRRTAAGSVPMRLARSAFVSPARSLSLSISRSTPSFSLSYRPTLRLLCPWRRFDADQLAACARLPEIAQPRHFLAELPWRVAMKVQRLPPAAGCVPKLVPIQASTEMTLLAESIGNGNNVVVAVLTGCAPSTRAEQVERSLVALPHKPSKYGY